MPILGWTRTSLIDYPGHIANVVFYGGCDYRCPMCHNGDLVLHPQQFPAVPEDRIFAHLRQRQGKITGMVITGGEPTLQPGLEDFIRGVRALDVAVKLDSNGYHSQVLEHLLDENLLDYVAMDIKAPPEKYALLAGLPAMDVVRIESSIRVLSQSGIPHEYRTTVVPTLLTPIDIVALVNWMVSLDQSDDYDYYLQQFRGGHTLDAAYSDLNPYSKQVLTDMQESVLDIMPRTHIRGL